MTRAAQEVVRPRLLSSPRLRTAADGHRGASWLEIVDLVLVRRSGARTGAPAPPLLARLG